MYPFLPISLSSDQPLEPAFCQKAPHSALDGGGRKYRRRERRFRGKGPWKGGVFIYLLFAAAIQLLAADPLDPFETDGAPGSTLQ